MSALARNSIIEKTSHAKEALYHSRHFCKNAKLAGKWVAKLDKYASHRAKASSSISKLNKFNDVHYAAFASEALIQQAGNGIKNLMTSSGSGLAFGDRVKKITGALISFVVNASTLVLFAEKNKVVSLVQKGRDYAPAVALAGSASLLLLKGGSFMRKGKKLANRDKNYSFVKIADFLCSLKSMVFGVARLASKPVSPGVAMTLDTVSSCYSMGKNIVHEAHSEASLRKVKAECRNLGLK